MKKQTTATVMDVQPHRFDEALLLANKVAYLLAEYKQAEEGYDAKRKAFTDDSDPLHAVSWNAAALARCAGYVDMARIVMGMFVPLLVQLCNPAHTPTGHDQTMQFFQWLRSTSDSGMRARVLNFLREQEVFFAHTLLGQWEETAAAAVQEATDIVVRHTFPTHSTCPYTNAVEADMREGKMDFVRARWGALRTRKV